MSSADKRVLIVGMPRCGTTLMATLLSAQRGVTFLTEYFHSFQEAAHRLDASWKTRLTLPQRRVVLAMVRDEFLRARHPVLVGAEQFETIDDLHRLVMDEVADSGCGVVGHKVVADPPKLKAVLGQTRIHCILMYRDPRDAALSFWHRVGGGVEDYLWTYRRLMALAIDAPPRLTAIKYETLIREPERAVGPLSRALGVDIDVSVPSLAFRKGAPSRNVAWSENSAFGDVKGRLDPAALERWRQHAASPVVRYAAWYCRRELRTWGYAAGADVAPREYLDLQLRRAAADSARRIRLAADTLTRLLGKVAVGER